MQFVGAFRLCFLPGLELHEPIGLSLVELGLLLPVKGQVTHELLPALFVVLLPLLEFFPLALLGYALHLHGLTLVTLQALTERL